MVHRGYGADSECIGEHLWWCFADELLPGAVANGAGGDAGVAEYIDDGLPVEMLAGHRAGEQPPRGRVAGGTGVGSVRQMIAQ